MTRPGRWGAWSGVLLCLTWAPMALAIPRLPDLRSAATVAGFWSTDLGLMQVVVISVSAGYLFLLVFLGALAERLGADAGVRAWSWTAVGAALVFTTALDVAIGLVIAAGLLAGADPAGAYALHVGGFVLAAPAAFAGAAFFVAVAVIAFGSEVLPRWSGWLALAGVVANVGAVGGVGTLTGPWNSGNGVIGGIAAPLGLFVVWILAISVWWSREPHDPSPDHPSPRDRTTAGGAPC
jgi:MFS family permease